MCVGFGVRDFFFVRLCLFTFKRTEFRRYICLTWFHHFWDIRNSIIAIHYRLTVSRNCSVHCDCGLTLYFTEFTRCCVFFSVSIGSIVQLICLDSCSCCCCHFFVVLNSLEKIYAKCKTTKNKKKRTAAAHTYPLHNTKNAYCFTNNRLWSGDVLCHFAANVIVVVGAAAAFVIPFFLLAGRTPNPAQACLFHFCFPTQSN